MRVSQPRDEEGGVPDFRRGVGQGVGEGVPQGMHAMDLRKAHEEDPCGAGGRRGHTSEYACHGPQEGP